MASTTDTQSGFVSTQQKPSGRSGIFSRKSLGNGTFSLYALLFYLFLYAPIIILVVFSFNESRFASQWGGFSLHWYRELFQDAAIGRALKNTMIISLTSTAISTVIGTMASVGMERYRFKGKQLFDGMLFLPIIIPDIAMAIMLMAFFVLTGSALEWVSTILNSILPGSPFNLGVKLGLGTIIIAHVAFNISFVAIIVRARMASIDPVLEEAAGDLYANEWQAFWRVTFPLLVPGILSGALLAFTLSLDDYVITFFASGVGSTTLTIRIYGLVKRGITPEINALSTLMLLASLSLVLLSLYMERKGEEL